MLAYFCFTRCWVPCSVWWVSCFWNLSHSRFSVFITCFSLSFILFVIHTHTPMSVPDPLFRLLYSLETTFVAPSRYYYYNKTETSSNTLTCTHSLAYLYLFEVTRPHFLSPSFSTDSRTNIDAPESFSGISNACTRSR